MTKTLLLSMAAVALAIVLLGVKVLFVKGARFPSGHVHSSPELRRRGISCDAHAQGPKSSQQRSAEKNNRSEISRQ